MMINLLNNIRNQNNGAGLLHTSIVLPDDPADICLDGNSLSHFITFVSIFVSLYFMDITPFYHKIKQSIHFFDSREVTICDMGTD